MLGVKTPFLPHVRQRPDQMIHLLHAARISTLFHEPQGNTELPLGECGGHDLEGEGGQCRQLMLS